MSVLRLFIAGDLHGAWGVEDQELLLKLQPDAVLFVGDLSEGDLRLVKAIKKLPFPIAVILGNHDRGNDPHGELLQTQLRLLGNTHCGWSYRDWDFPSLAVVGARPCSAGGGFHLSNAAEAAFGPVTMQESAERIFLAAQKAPEDWPLIILAHSGPTGLGSDAISICGRDWKPPALDWGDQDLALALDKIRKVRIPQLVVFGHMHHKLKRGSGYRRTFFKDNFGTCYLNTACVPRKGTDKSGRFLCHFSYVEIENSSVSHISHRWYLADSSIAYEERLL